MGNRKSTDASTLIIKNMSDIDTLFEIHEQSKNQKILKEYLLKPGSQVSYKLKKGDELEIRAINTVDHEKLGSIPISRGSILIFAKTVEGNYWFGCEYNPPKSHKQKPLYYTMTSKETEIRGEPTGDTKNNSSAPEVAGETHDTKEVINYPEQAQGEEKHQQEKGIMVEKQEENEQSGEPVAHMKKQEILAEIVPST